MERLDLNGRRSGKMKVHCPLCREQRKDKRDKSVSVDLDKGVAYCHYCGETFKTAPRHVPPAHTSTTPRQPAPPPLEKTGMRPEHIQWFHTERGISKETLLKMDVGSKEEFMPQTGKKEWCICFNYVENGKLTNTKFRDMDKHFKMVSGRELIPYHIDGIRGTEECIVVEGEIDCLSFVEMGRTDVISVPAGANTNLTWMDRFVESHFEDKKVIYIAVDNDRKGLELRKELIGRLGTERCRILEYPEGCKDANEVLTRHGSQQLKQALEEAAEIPVEGVFTLKDVCRELRILFEEGIHPGAETGWENFDRLCTFETGRLCVVTGIPNTGKSEFVDELVMRLNLRNEWKAAFFSPENMPMTYHLRKLMEKAGGCPFNKGDMPEPVYNRAERYLTENFNFILPEEDFTVDHILDIARSLVRKQGIKTLTIDPFNRFEHQVPHGYTETQYISAVLDKFTNFALRNNCLVILVAHPRKMNKVPGTLKEPVPTLYDINGSAAFFNKCDFGLVVNRDYIAQVVRIHVEKVKFKHLGEKGEAIFQYNTNNGRYTPCEIDEQTGKPWKALFDNEEWTSARFNEQVC